MSQATTQLQCLTDFLLSQLSTVIKANDIDAWQEHGELHITGEDKGANSYLLAKWQHTAVIAIERFPHRKCNPYNVFALVAAYMIDTQPQTDTAPQFDIEVISKDHAQILIEVELVDDIEVTPNEHGCVLFQGQHYQVEQSPIYVAETLDTKVSIKGDE